MIFEPHTYQEYATRRILEQPAVGLFLDMGMGKTVCALTAAAELLHDRFDVTRVLVIAPLRVAEDTWSRESEKWDHLQYLRISKVLGSERERKAALGVTADIYIINRENVEWLVNHYGKEWPFDMVIVDELSSFKSPKARRFRALRKARPLVSRITGLTGTPAPNGLIDLWSQIYLLDQGERLGKTVTGYRERYFRPDKRSATVIYSWALKPGAEDAIHQKLSDLCVSMSAKDWLEMPERVNSVVSIRLSPEARARYDRLERDLLLPFAGGDVVADTSAVLSNKLLQMANGAVYDEYGQVQLAHNEKLAVLDEILDTCNGKPVLVFYAYRHDLTRIQQYLRERKPRTLNTSADIEDWNKGRIPVLLAHPASAGHGLNLQAGGNIIVWFGLTWSLELYQQGIARLDRQGQQSSVIVHHLVAEGTVDEDVMRAIENKAVGQDALLAAVKARIAKIVQEVSR